MKFQPPLTVLGGEEKGGGGGGGRRNAQLGHSGKSLKSRGKEACPPAICHSPERKDGVPINISV